MEGMGALYGILLILLIIIATLALLVSFFVFRIRNEIISINKKMSVFIKLLDGLKIDIASSEVEDKIISSSDNHIKTCPSCGVGNRLENHSCMGCGKAL